MKNLLFISIIFLCISCSSKPVIDLEKEKNAILQTDKEYSEALATKDIQKVAGYLDENATFVGREVTANGKNETVKNWMDNFSDPSYSMIRNPKSASVSANGDIGYSMGPYEIMLDSTMTKGTYLYIWKKQPDGNWKALVLKP